MENVKKFDSKRGLIFSSVFVALMVAMSTYAWMHIPGDARIPMHWGLSGEPDRYGDKFEALVFGPTFTFFLSGLFALLPNIEPRKAHLLSSSQAYFALWFAVLLVMLVVHAIILETGLGFNVQAVPTISFTIGGLFLVIGNYMGKIRSNFFFGIRTPWTLSSELSWDRTHRIGGWLFCLSGAATMISCFMSNGAWSLMMILGTTLINVVALYFYSYYVWKQDASRSPMAK